MAQSPSLHSWLSFIVIVCISSHAQAKCLARFTITPSAISFTAGQVVSFTYTMTNTGTEPISDVTIDSTATDSCHIPGPVAVGASASCIQTHGPMTEAQMNSCHKIVNQATVSGQCSGGGVSTVTKTSIVKPKGIAFQLRLDPASVLPQTGPVVFTYYVKNIGFVPINSIAVTSSIGASCFITNKLKPGEEAKCQGIYTLTLADVTTREVVPNTATAVAAYACGSRLTVRTANIYTQKPQYRTQAVADWSAKCESGNMGCYLGQNFGSCFQSAGRFTVGYGNTITFKSAADLQCMLTTSGGFQTPLPPRRFDLSACAVATPAQCSTCTPNLGTLASEVVAAMLNVGFDTCDPSFSPASPHAKNAVLRAGLGTSACSPGQSVSQIIANAQQCLGRTNCNNAPGFVLCLRTFNECFKDAANSCSQYL